MKRGAFRIAFAVYAAALFIGTHIPDLQIRVGHIERPDLFIHMVAFGGWFCLLLISEYLGPWRSPRSVAMCAAIAVACAGIDEYSQSLPVLNRTAAWDDFAANVSGIVLAAGITLLLGRFLPARQPPTASAPPA